MVPMSVALGLVEIIKESASSAWFAPIVGFMGSALLFVGGLIGVWWTNKNADQRQRGQLATMQAEGRTDRVAQRNDRFREEVANLLGERWATDNAAYELATAADEYSTDKVRPEVSPHDRVTAVLEVRDEHTPQLNKIEHLAICASLLTNDAEISGVLTAIRRAAQVWKELVDGDPIEKYMGMRDVLDNSFSQLETFTRTLVTSDGTTGQAAQCGTDGVTDLSPFRHG